MIDLIIKNGKIIDGTGEPPYTSDIAVDNGKIIQIGDSSSLNSKKTYDVTGKTVTPGFIDIHTHSDFPLFVDGSAQSGIRQGLTTAVIGNCGLGPAPAPNKELTKQITIESGTDTLSGSIVLESETIPAFAEAPSHKINVHPPDLAVPAKLASIYLGNPVIMRFSSRI